MGAKQGLSTVVSLEATPARLGSRAPFIKTSSFRPDLQAPRLPPCVPQVTGSPFLLPMTAGGTWRYRERERTPATRGRSQKALAEGEVSKLGPAEEEGRTLDLSAFTRGHRKPEEEFSQLLVTETLILRSLVS